MKSFKILSVIMAVAFLSSCSHPKQFSTCSEITKDLNGSYYNDLVKEWGEPSVKEVHGDTWYIKWSGIGVKGTDKEMMFNTAFITTVEYPSSFKGVECN